MNPSSSSSSSSSSSHGCRHKSTCPVAETCPASAAGSTHHFHLPESAASMTPEQLLALSGSQLQHAPGAAPIGDIEDLVAPRSAPRAAAPRQSGDIFDSAVHAATRRPLLDSSTLESACYTSQDWFEEEQSMLSTSWTIVGRVDEVPEQGDFLTVDT